MCGIVGYTGPREAGPHPHRRAATPRVPRLRLGRIALVDDAGDLFVEKRAGKLANLQTAIAERTPARGRSASPTPAGRRTAGRTTSTPIPHQDCTGRDHGHPQRDHRELPRARATGSRPAATARAPRPTPRRSPTSSRRPTAGDLADAVRAALAPGRRAPTRSWRCIGGEGDRLVGARQDVPLVVGLGDGESFLASDVAGDPRAHATRSCSSRTATSPICARAA